MAMIAEYRWGMCKPGIGDTLAAVCAVRWIRRNTGFRIRIPRSDNWLSEMYGDGLCEVHDNPQAWDLMDCCHRDWHGQQYHHNYLGLHIAALGACPPPAPQLVLPRVCRKPKTRVVIQPAAVWGPNPATAFVQQVVDGINFELGVRPVAVGADWTPRDLQRVDFSKLGGRREMFESVARARLMITPRSGGAHIAAGYHVPTICWRTPDPWDWHLDYPEWDVCWVDPMMPIHRVLDQVLEFASRYVT